MPPSEKKSAIWEPSIWDTLHNKLSAAERFRASMSVQKMCQQMTQASRRTTSLSNRSKANGKDDIAEASTAKRKAEEVSGEDDPTLLSKKIRRKKVKGDKT